MLNLTIAGLLRDEAATLETAIEHVRPDAPDELVDSLEPLVTGEDVESLSTSGYVIHSLQTALHDSLGADSADEAIVTAVNRGGDTDTIGAIAGAVAGARFGAESLPEDWLSTLESQREISRLATRLWDS